MSDLDAMIEGLPKDPVAKNQRLTVGDAKRRRQLATGSVDGKVERPNAAPLRTSPKEPLLPSEATADIRARDEARQELRRTIDGLRAAVENMEARNVVLRQAVTLLVKSSALRGLSVEQIDFIQTVRENEAKAANDLLRRITEGVDPE